MRDNLQKSLFVNVSLQLYMYLWKFHFQIFETLSGIEQVQNQYFYLRILQC